MPQVHEHEFVSIGRALWAIGRRIRQDRADNKPQREARAKSDPVEYEVKQGTRLPTWLWIVLWLSCCPLAVIMLVVQHFRRKAARVRVRAAMEVAQAAEVERQFRELQGERERMMSGIRS